MPYGLGTAIFNQQSVALPSVHSTCALVSVASSYVLAEEPPGGPLSIGATEFLRLRTDETLTSSHHFSSLSHQNVTSKTVYVSVINKWIQNRIRPTHDSPPCDFKSLTHRLTLKRRALHKSKFAKISVPPVILHHLPPRSHTPGHISYFSFAHPFTPYFSHQCKETFS